MCFDEYLLTFKEGGETPTTPLGCLYRDSRLLARPPTTDMISSFPDSHYHNALHRTAPFARGVPRVELPLILVGVLPPSLSSTPFSRRYLEFRPWMRVSNAKIIPSPR